MEPKADMCDAATINVIMEEIKCTRTKDNENKEEPKIKEKEDIKIPREKRKISNNKCDFTTRKEEKPMVFSNNKV